MTDHKHVWGNPTREKVMGEWCQVYRCTFVDDLGKKCEAVKAVAEWITKRKEEK